MNYRKLLGEGWLWAWVGEYEPWPFLLGTAWYPDMRPGSKSFCLLIPFNRAWSWILLRWYRLKRPQDGVLEYAAMRYWCAQYDAEVKRREAAEKALDDLKGAP